MAYIIAITETDLTNLKEPSKQILLISSEHADLENVFLEDGANALSEHRNHDLRSETTGTPLFEPFYNLSENEIEVLREYIADNLAKEFIKPSIYLISLDTCFVCQKERWELTFICGL